MRCREVQPLLVALEDGELSPSQVVLVERHLGTCSACKDLSASLMAVTPRPGPPLRDDELQPLWERLDQAVAQELENPRAPERPTWRQWTSRRLQGEVVLPASQALLYAAALLLVGFWGLGQWRTASELQLALEDARRVPAAFGEAPAEVLPAEAYREASWAPPVDEAP